MNSSDLFGPGQIGDGACDTQDPVEPSCRQAHRRGRVCEELASSIVGRRNTVEQLTIRLGVGSYA